jgi:hypothetical protein
MIGDERTPGGVKKSAPVDNSILIPIKPDDNPAQVLKDEPKAVAPPQPEAKPVVKPPEPVSSQAPPADVKNPVVSAPSKQPAEQIPVLKTHGSHAHSDSPSKNEESEESREVLQDLKSQKQEIMTQISDVHQKIREIKQSLLEEKLTEAQKLAKKEEKLVLKRREQDLLDSKEALGQKMKSLKKKLYLDRGLAAGQIHRGGAGPGQQATKAKLSKDNIDLSLLKPGEMDEIVKEVIQELMPSIARKVVIKLRQKFGKGGDEKEAGPDCSNCQEPNIRCDFFKCTKCQNYTLCGKCELKNSHPHLLMKIGKTLNPDGANTLTQNDSKEAAKLQKPEENALKAPASNGYSMTYDIVSTLPKEIVANDEKIFVTLELKNNGLQAWPKDTKAIYMRGAATASPLLLLPAVNVGDRHKATFVFDNPKKSGYYESFWRLGFEKPGDPQTIIGEEIKLMFIVKDIPDPKAKKGTAAPVPKEPEKPVQIGEGDPALTEALKFCEAFPDLSLEQIVAVIKSHPKANEDEKINLLLSMKP